MLKEADFLETKFEETIKIHNKPDSFSKSRAESGSDNFLKELILKSLHFKKETNIALAYLPSPNLKVKEPFLVNIWDEDGKVITHVPELEVEGIGRDLTEAIIELQLTIEELYDTLTKDRNNLGPHMVQILNILEQKITKE